MLFFMVVKMLIFMVIMVLILVVIMMANRVLRLILTVFYTFFIVREVFTP